MARCNLNEHHTFSKAFDASVDQIQATGRQRRQLMQEAWEGIDKGWQALQQRLVEVGIMINSEEGVLRLNVGGSHVNVSQSILSGHGFPELHTLASLLDRVWDKRLPRDEDGFIVLDESPTCVKYILRQALHNALGTASQGESKLALLLGDDLPPDEKAHLPHVFHAIGVPELPSTVLGPDELGPMSATILDWCPGKPLGLELVYRASRDGWAPRDFHSRCDISPTVTLYRVSNTCRETRDSVVGGFNSVTWAPVAHSWRSSPGAFVFMLKDGESTGSTTFKPVKWGLNERKSKRAVWCNATVGPWFGCSLGMDRKGSFQTTLKTSSNGSYDVPADTPFLALDDHDVVEIETFRVCSATTKPYSTHPKSDAGPGLVDIPPFDITTMSAEHGREDDIRTFGVSIAHSLMEERSALRHAHEELEDANTKTAASVEALAVVYGPHVAAGNKEDTVIELSVRGTRMVTLRSTLQACPNSALATQFDEGKWPATDKDVDEHGRRLVDCRPSVFSKVLDVLRMRKRAAWSSSSGGSRESNVRVVVKAADHAEFEEFVGMYFPGCESFIMDFVADTARNQNPVPKKRKK